VTTSLYPAVTDALVAILTPLEAVKVYDGWAVTQDYNNNLLVGVSDLQPDGPQAAGTEEQDWAHANYTYRSDNGNVFCTASAWTGDANAKTARDAVKAILAIVENQLRTDPTLGGVPGLLWTGFGTDMTWQHAQGKAGAFCSCTFSVQFRGQI
jgi:hypothetical protein